MQMQQERLTSRILLLITFSQSFTLNTKLGTFQVWLLQINHFYLITFLLHWILLITVSLT